MNTIIVACKTLENELTAAMKASGCSHEIRWIESGLHNVPRKLHSTLQNTLDQGRGYDTVLLVMGFCGNSVAEIRTHDFTLVMPRVDDCISLLLGSVTQRMQQAASGSTYFLTEGWLEGERNIWKEYEYTMEKYGPELGQEIFDTMFQHYQNLALIDTGCFDMSKAIAETKEIAQKLELNYVQLSGTISYLQELLSQTWDPERFIVVAPHSQLALAECTCKELNL
ncbi:MAG: DUF1638 domain-containing protein [Lachnospiraceae bacterium]